MSLNLIKEYEMKANKISKNIIFLPALLAAATISGGAIAAPGDKGTLTNNISGVCQPGTEGLALWWSISLY